jgi:pre-mRNA cleavage complex 2 protein Pcf11
MLLNESSLIREAERRSLTQENIQNKENRMFGRGGPRFPAAGPDFREPEMLGGPDTGNGPIFELDVPRLGVSPHKNDLPLADPADLAEIAKDPTKSMHIDGKSRSIRHYGETATIVLEDDQICELSFQSEPEPRRVIINDTIVVRCALNAPTGYTEFVLHGEIHRIKIGSPSRELWIDGEWYDCYFNRKIRVKIGAGWHSVVLDGPLPSVKIGAQRPDLCRGRLYLLVDGDVEHRIPLYLDRKPQLAEVSLLSLIFAYLPYLFLSFAH